MFRVMFVTESDASSEHSVSSSGSTSISSRNTLLAMNSHQVNRAINKIQDDMRIDSALFNPDSLWKREQAGWVTGRNPKFYISVYTNKIFRFGNSP